MKRRIRIILGSALTGMVIVAIVAMIALRTVRLPSNVWLGLLVGGTLATSLHFVLWKEAR